MQRPPESATEPRALAGAFLVPIGAVRPVRQPRRWFDPDKLAMLAASIRERGILQPLLVRADGRGGYLVLAGERRLRAARQLGLTEIPVLVRDVDDADALLETLIENVVRADLTLEEEAGAYQRLLDLGLSQREIGRRTGINQGTISRALRLWADETLGDAVTTGALGQAEAQELLSLPAEERKPLVEVLTARRRAGEAVSRPELRALVERQRRTGSIPVPDPAGPAPLIRHGIVGAPLRPTPTQRDAPAGDALRNIPPAGPTPTRETASPTDAQRITPPAAPPPAAVPTEPLPDGVEERARLRARSRARALRLHIDVEFVAIRPWAGDPLVREELTAARRALTLPEENA
jgi:ParB family chromosome partitioning protein